MAIHIQLLSYENTHTHPGPSGKPVQCHPNVAQTVPNGGFETWVTRSNLEVPQSWTTFDEAIEASPLGSFYSSVTTTKNAGSRTGAFAARMETTLDPLLGALLGPAPGAVLLGRVDVDGVGSASEDLDISDVGGLPYTVRSANMQFYYRLTGPNALPDSAYALVALTRTVGGNVQTIASGALRLQPAANYTLATVPLTYRSSLTPDSLHIAFASGVASAPTAGTVLFVDDVVMTGTVASTQDAALAAALNIFPNPSTNGVFTVAASGRESDLTNATLTVRNMLGSVVLQQPAGRAGRARTLDLQAQPAGIYTLRLDTPSGFVVQKLVKQ